MTGFISDFANRPHAQPASRKEAVRTSDYQRAHRVSSFMGGMEDSKDRGERVESEIYAIEIYSGRTLQLKTEQ